MLPNPAPYPTTEYIPLREKTKKRNLMAHLVLIGVLLSAFFLVTLTTTITSKHHHGGEAPKASKTAELTNEGTSSIETKEEVQEEDGGKQTIEVAKLVLLVEKSEDGDNGETGLNGVDEENAGKQQQQHLEIALAVQDRDSDDPSTVSRSRVRRSCCRRGQRGQCCRCTASDSFHVSPSCGLNRICNCRDF